MLKLFYLLIQEVLSTVLNISCVAKVAQLPLSFKQVQRIFPGVVWSQELDFYVKDCLYPYPRNWGS